MWKRILVPHDFSSSANCAAALARDEAKIHGGEILLLHVIDLPYMCPPDVMVAANGGRPVGMREYSITAATEHLRDLARRLEADGVKVSSFVRVGLAVDEILDFAKEQGADTIMMGTHGRTGFHHLIAGSVTERVVRSSDIPVLTTRHP